jgi:recombination protein RecA
MRKDNRWQQTLWDIQKRWGEKAISPLHKLRKETEGIPTGFPALDGILSANGIARNCLTELRGTPTSGMTTLAHHITARAQANEQVAAYVDLSGTLDPDFAARCGVNLDRLLVIQPSRPAKALEITRDLVTVGKLRLVVIDDLIGKKSGLDRIRSPEAALRLVEEALHKSDCALLFLRSAASSALLEPFAQTRLLVERVAWIYHYQDVQGYQARITVLKDKPLAADTPVTIDLTFERGVEGEA